MQYEFAETQPWYRKLLDRDGDADFAHYLANDLSYKNKVSAYFRVIYDQIGLLYLFQSQLVDLYLKIHEVTGTPKELPPLIKEYYVDLPLSEKEKLVGTYNADDAAPPIEITLEDGQLFMSSFPVKMLKNGRMAQIVGLYARHYTYSSEEQKFCRKALDRKQRCYIKK